ncbi:hypothetical protein QBC43DRAFT_316786 [Cladorrhinum sp. PSN259]|nr:hypothetical protein QBC43DRAFT_316786 [Cladorrhinum sp. PSN259]
MPYSDNLYSMVDDDEESNYGFVEDPQTLPAQTSSSQQHETSVAEDQDDNDDADILSPSDGYFNNRSEVSLNTPAAATSFNVPRVPDVLVQDPSLPQGSTAESKAREAEEERRNNVNRPSSPGTSSNTGVYRPHVDTSSLSSASATHSSPYVGQQRQQQQHSSIVPPSSQSSERGATHYQPSASSSNFTPSVAGSSTASYTSYPPRRVAYYGNERSRFLPPQEAPPAYTPSPTSPRSTQSTSDTVRNYRTFSPAVPVNVNTMGRWDETRALLGRDPESMRDPHVGTGEDGSGRMGWIRRRAPSIIQENWKTSFLGLIFFFVAIGLFISALTGGGGDKKPHSPKPPSMEHPDVDRSISWPSNSICKANKIARPTQTFDLSFDSDNLKPLSIIQTVIEDHSHYNWRHIHVQGEVILRRVGSSIPGPSLVLEITVNDERIQVPTDWDASLQWLKVKTPNQIEWDNSGPGPCVHVKATVWVPGEDNKSILDFLEVSTVHLDIKLLDDLALSVSQATKLSSTVGTISSASTGSDSRDKNIINTGSPDGFIFNSRFIEVKTTAAPILGAWPLYDYLSLQSTSGSIKVFISPKEEGDKENPKPAILYIKSMSGDITFREPIEDARQAYKMEKALKDSGYGLVGGMLVTKGWNKRVENVLPIRDYRVEVLTTSGNVDVRGGVAFSSQVGLKSTSGNLRAQLLPILFDAAAEGNRGKDIKVVTGSTSGDTDVEMLEALWWLEGDGRRTQGQDNNNQGKNTWPGYLLPVVPNDGGKQVVKVGKGDDDDGKQKERPLRNMYGTHTTTSGDIKVKYPAEWEGDIHMSTLSGSLKVGGDGVRVIKAGNDWPGVNKRLVARKGEEGKGAVIKVSSTSGDNEVLIGPK